MLLAKAICFTFDVHEIVRAFSRALLNAGNNIAANIAMIAITTSNSIKVKQRPFADGTISSQVLLCFAHCMSASSLAWF